jgi:putative FmdB family regulatory protein
MAHDAQAHAAVGEEEIPMPLFEFHCRDCGSRFEVLTSYEQSRGEMVCATCSSRNVKKLMPLVARRGKAESDFADSYGADDGMDADDDFDGPGCGCGGACSCLN